jgi:hypothetical protein
VVVWRLHATGFFAALESEQGTLSGNAALVGDSGASGGQAVQFRAPGTPSPAPSPTPTPSPGPGGRTCPAYPAFPDGNCTGVPSGVTLTSYNGCSGGESVIAANNTVIDSKDVGCTLVIRATGVIIKNSRIHGTVGTTEDVAGSATITDTEITGGAGTHDLTLLRVNVYGGTGPNFYCYENCSITDSWLHSPSFPTEGCGTPTQCLQAHLGAFLANDNGHDPGGTTNVILKHNRIHCDTPPSSEDGGCSGDVNLFGDFGPISHVTIDQNYLGGSSGISYCFYGGDSTTKPYPYGSYISFTNNIFQKAPTGHCGAYGPVDSFGTDAAHNPGNVWGNNKYDDGTPVSPNG